MTVLGDSWRIVFFNGEKVRLSKEKLQEIKPELKSTIKSKVKDVDFDDESLIIDDENFHAFIKSEDEIKDAKDIKLTVEGLNKAICDFAVSKNLIVLFELILEVIDDNGSAKIASYVVDFDGCRSEFTFRTTHEQLKKTDVNNIVLKMCKSFKKLPWEVDLKGELTQKGKTEKYDIETLFMKNLFYRVFKSDQKSDEDDENQEN